MFISRLIKVLNNNKSFLFILVLYLILAGLLLNPDLPLEGDSSIFFNLAKSISSGCGYKDIYFPGSPTHIQYPQFYPLLLSLALIIFPKTIVTLKIVSILFGLASLVAIHILFSDKLGVKNIKFTTSTSPLTTYPLSLIVLFTCTNMWFLSFSIALIPEMVYLFFSILTLIIAKRYAEEKSLINRYLWFLLVSLGIVFYTKTIGLSLSLAVILYLFFIVKDCKKGILITCWELVLILFWIKSFILITQQNVISQNYITQLFPVSSSSCLSMTKLILSNLLGYFRSLSSLFLPAYFLGEEGFEGRRYFFLLYSLINKGKFFNVQSLPVFSGLMVVFIGVITSCGYIHRMITNKEIDEIYVSCYLFILLVSPSCFYAYSSNRYLLALFPFLIYYFFSGICLILRYIRQKTIKKFGYRICYIVITVLLAGNLFPTIFWIKNNVAYVINYKYLSNEEKRDYHPFWLRDYFTSAYWMEENTIPEAVIMHFCPPAFYLYSSRKTVFFDTLPYKPRGKVFEEIKLIIKEKKVGYIVESHKKQRKIINLLNKDLKDFIFTPLIEFPQGGIIYKVVKVSSRVKLLNKEGVCWYNEGNYNKAILKFRKSIKLEPDFVTYYNLGRCYEKKKMLEMSLGMYEKAIRIQPNYELARNRYKSVLLILQGMDNK